MRPLLLPLLAPCQRAPMPSLPLRLPTRCHRRRCCCFALLCASERDIFRYYASYAQQAAQRSGAQRRRADAGRDGAAASYAMPATPPAAAFAHDTRCCCRHMLAAAAYFRPSFVIIALMMPRLTTLCSSPSQLAPARFDAIARRYFYAMVADVAHATVAQPAPPFTFCYEQRYAIFIIMLTVTRCHMI